ncbi:DNA primase family protein [Pseudodesulfovibrio tunisiensis]|uniref:DNA primase family protein n=1 Tax=Pseudodesulfovibrio tunisiensis TaxID=463192 RepID=UPI001FB30AF7|nr:phage/plasmid primase, P4 family [Pseudodesulfovibrio tunisiensis]
MSNDSKKISAEVMPRLTLPQGYSLHQDTNGHWDVVPPPDADLSDPKVLGLLTDLRRSLEEVLSPSPPGASRQDGPPQEMPRFRPWENLDPAWILTSMYRNVTGDAEVYAAMHKDHVAINITTGGDRKTPETLRFTGHHWVMDSASVYAHSLMENVALSYQYAHQMKVVVSFQRKIGELEERVEKAVTEEEKTLLAADVLSLKKALAAKNKAVRERMNSLRSPNRENSVMTKVRSIAGFPLNCESWWLDNRPDLLPVANGVVDLTTGRHRPGRPEDWMVRAAPVEWRGEDADRKDWLECLNGIYANPETGEPYQDLIAFIQRLCGYALLGATPNHILPILTGRGRNGKSTLLNTLYKVLGPLAGALPSELLLDQGVNRSADSPTPSIMSLKGLRLAWASETAEGRKFSIDRVKWLTGGDPLTGRHPNDKYPTTFAPTHLMFLLTNNLPSAPATDYAFWKRVMAIPHAISFVHGEPTQPWERTIDPDLDAKLEQCLPGILAWLVEGHLAWRRYGLNPPAIVTEATAQYREGEDMLGEFLFECCDVDENLRVGSSKLYEVFKQWHHKRMGKFEPSQKKFGSWMKDKGFEKIKSGTILYQGLALKERHFEGFNPQED